MGEQNENEPYFEPIVKLDEVEVKTGEEDDEVLFVSRAKLYRYVGAEWKERGLGDIKILRSGASGRARVLMRRENIHKLCANHYILDWMSMSKMAGKENTRIWVAFDDTMDDDTEPTKQQFCVRFKEADTAPEFETVFMANRASGDAAATAAASSAPVKEPEETPKPVFGATIAPVVVE